jgi:hypothetical protein
MTKKRSPRKKKALPPVSLGGVCVEEGLPYPVVHYPNHYGAFFAFSEAEGAEACLCDCSRSAFENLIELNKHFRSQRNSNPLRETVVDSFNTPDVLAKISLDAGGNVNYENFRFKPKLCHRCNLTPPTQRFCHEMYGGQFKQSFGWYIQQAYLRLGISTTSLEYLEDICPAEYKALIQEIEHVQLKYQEEHTRINEIVYGPDREDIAEDEVTYWHNVRKDEAEQLLKLRKEHQRLRTKLKNNIENIVRQKFGFKKVGEGWVSETLLYQIIARIFPDLEIVRHHRPDWLEGLELDIYMPRLKLGIEYQGQQHYQPISIWGGKGALISLQERDERKRKLCKALNITLMKVDFTEPLTNEYIKNRLNELKILSHNQEIA